jgi:xanthine dehydrogenase YagT iron-sulfur-binding subunit
MSMADSKPDGKLLSRRSFLRGSAVTTVGASAFEIASGFMHEAEAAGPAAALGPGPVPIVMTVNGIERRLEVEPSATLADTLRGPLGLTGTKVGCDRGSCGSCTVWLDGAPVNSCMVLAIDVGPRRVTTIEALAQGDSLHPVQAAFIAHDALQCGFCTPGLVMSCAALLERRADPDEAEVRAAIAGHYCRCGTYPHVVAATLAAARGRRG